MLEKVEYVLVKIHKGSIVEMLMTKQWPNKPYPKDTTSLPCREILRNTSKKCEKCQMFTPISQMAPLKLTMLVITWSFSQKELDII